MSHQRPGERSGTQHIDSKLEDFSVSVCCRAIGVVTSLRKIGLVCKDSSTSLRQVGRQALQSSWSMKEGG